MNSLNSSLLASSSYDESARDHTRFPQERFTPLFAIHETPEAYEIEAELPKSRRRDVSVKPRRHYIEVWCSHACDHDDEDALDGISHPAHFGSFVSRLTLS